MTDTLPTPIEGGERHGYFHYGAAFYRAVLGGENTGGSVFGSWDNGFTVVASCDSTVDLRWDATNGAPTAPTAIAEVQITLTEDSELVQLHEQSPLPASWDVWEVWPDGAVDQRIEIEGALTGDPITVNLPVQTMYKWGYRGLDNGFVVGDSASDDPVDNYLTLFVYHRASSRMATVRVRIATIARKLKRKCPADVENDQNIIELHLDDIDARLDLADDTAVYVDGRWRIISDRCLLWGDPIVYGLYRPYGIPNLQAVLANKPGVDPCVYGVGAYSLDKHCCGGYGDIHPQQNGGCHVANTFIGTARFYSLERLAEIVGCSRSIVDLECHIGNISIAITEGPPYPRYNDDGRDIVYFGSSITIPAIYRRYLPSGAEIDPVTTDGDDTWSDDACAEVARRCIAYSAFTTAISGELLFFEQHPTLHYLYRVDVDVKITHDRTYGSDGYGGNPDTGDLYTPICIKDRYQPFELSPSGMEDRGLFTITAYSNLWNTGDSSLSLDSPCFLSSYSRQWAQAEVSLDADALTYYQQDGYCDDPHCFVYPAKPKCGGGCYKPSYIQCSATLRCDGPEEGPGAECEDQETVLEIKQEMATAAEDPTVVGGNRRRDYSGCVNDYFKKDDVGQPIPQEALTDDTCGEELFDPYIIHDLRLSDGGGYYFCRHGSVIDDECDDRETPSCECQEGSQPCWDGGVVFDCSSAFIAVRATVGACGSVGGSVVITSNDDTAQWPLPDELLYNPCKAPCWLASDIPGLDPDEPAGPTVFTLSGACDSSTLRLKKTTGACGEEYVVQTAQDVTFFRHVYEFSGREWCDGAQSFGYAQVLASIAESAQESAARLRCSGIGCQIGLDGTPSLSVTGLSVPHIRATARGLTSFQIDAKTGEPIETPVASTELSCSKFEYARVSDWIANGAPLIVKNNEENLRSVNDDPFIFPKKYTGHVQRLPDGAYDRQGQLLATNGSVSHDPGAPFTSIDLANAYVEHNKPRSTGDPVEFWLPIAYAGYGLDQLNRVVIANIGGRFIYREPSGDPESSEESMFSEDDDLMAIGVSTILGIRVPKIGATPHWSVNGVSMRVVGSTEIGIFPDGFYRARPEDERSNPVPIGQSVVRVAGALTQCQDTSVTEVDRLPLGNLVVEGGAVTSQGWYGAGGYYRTSVTVEQPPDNKVVGGVSLRVAGGSIYGTYADVYVVSPSGESVFVARLIGNPEGNYTDVRFDGSDTGGEWSIEVVTTNSSATFSIVGIDLVFQVVTGDPPSSLDPTLFDRLPPVGWYGMFLNEGAALETLCCSCDNGLVSSRETTRELNNSRSLVGLIGFYGPVGVPPGTVQLQEEFDENAGQPTLGEYFSSSSSSQSDVTATGTP